MMDQDGFELFYSYAPKDEKLRNELEKHLFNLKKQGLIVDWNKRNISAGTEWAQAIDAHLNSAQIILLLISPDFLCSDYCYSVEMTRALERHEAGEARVIPIILQSVDWQDAPFSKLLVLPRNGRAIARWKNRNDAFFEVVKGIREVVKELKTLPSFNAASLPAQSTNGSLPEQAPFSVALEEDQIQVTNTAPAWNVPYQRNALFTGREDILQHVHEIFTRETVSASMQPLVLSGLGGMGKTQIALEYAYRYREGYHDILWAKADSPELLASELASFATLLNVPGQREQDQQYALDAVKRWLEVHADWLLILDNIEDLKMTSTYLPTQPKGHILFTARTQVMGGRAYRLEIDKLTPHDGALLLLRRIGRLLPAAAPENVDDIEFSQASEVAQMLDGLPLALDQAGAYMEETGASFQRYLGIYAQRRFDLLKTRGEAPSEHPQPVTTTLSLSFEKVAESNPIALELLRFLAFLHPDEIPEALLEKGASQLGPELQAKAADPFELDQILGELRKYSLIRRNPDSATLTVHRLVQDVLKDSLDQPTQRRWAERAIRAINYLFPQVEFANWPTCQQYLPQAQICSTLIETWHFTFPETSRLLHETGHYLHGRGQYSEAASLIAQALAIREQMLGANHLDVAACLHDLAEAHRQQGHYAESEPLYRRALTIRENILGTNHPDVATSLNHLARPYHHQARYTEAEDLYKQALEIREQTLGATHPDVAQSLNDLGVLYSELGHNAESEPLLKRSLAIREQTLGATHPDVALSLNNLAGFYREQGHNAESEPLHKRALEIREQTLGATHPDVAQSLNNLAGLYEEQDYNAEAGLLYERALAICEQVLGPHHPDTASCLNNLGALYRKQDRFAEAEALYKQALEIRKQVFGPHHPDTADSLNSLGILYGKRGRYAEAEPLLKRALAIREQIFDSYHPDIANSLNNLGMFYRERGRYAEAEPLLKRALAIREQIFGSHHSDTATSLGNLARLYLSKRNYKRAEPLFKCALAIMERERGPEHPDTVKILRSYLSLLKASGQKDKAASIALRLKAIQPREESASTSGS